jgi:putative transposase
VIAEGQVKGERRKTIQHFNDPGHAHFLTFSCYKQLPLLSSDRTKLWLVQAINESKNKHRFSVFAYVIMPEHVHLIVQPLNQHYDIALILKSIKQSVARKAKHFLQDHNQVWLERLTVRRGSTRAFRFWQVGPGYDRNIRDEQELIEKIEYIHGNPVRRGLVQTPEAWLWSSAGRNSMI